MPTSELVPLDDRDLANHVLLVDRICRSGEAFRLSEAPPSDLLAEHIDHLREGGGVVLALRVEGRYAGFAELLRTPVAGCGHEARLLLGIDPEHRGRGHGRRLLAGAVVAAALVGITRIETETWVDNHPGVSLLLAGGFLTEGRRRQARWREGRWWDALTMARVEPG